jgi:hypothetical protein
MHLVMLIGTPLEILKDSITSIAFTFIRVRGRVDAAKLAAKLTRLQLGPIIHAMLPTERR